MGVEFQVDEELHHKQQLMMLYGEQSNSYFHFQEDVQCFLLRDIGYISYFHQKGLLTNVNIVFCNPICAEENLPQLFTAYFEQCSVKTLFMGLDIKVAKVLKQFGYSINHIGPEFWMPIQEYKVSGRKMRNLRHARNLGDKGFSVKEQSWGEVDQVAVKAISEQWRKTKKTKHQELRLLTRPPEFRDAWGVRRFYCYKDDKIVGYVFFDPYFKDGKVIGYCANILRSDPAIHPSDFLDFTILEAMKIFKQEGVQTLSLGLSPFYDIQKHDDENKPIRHVMQMFYKYGNVIYAFKQLAFHKTRYKGQTTGWYACIKDISVPRLVLISIIALNVF
ncbi:MAG: DUF2156 domain-containing protein [Pseudomonadales bacterium]|nr:DUF2156 domain-containing protein [Pseudomonadales bacterium]